MKGRATSQAKASSKASRPAPARKAAPKQEAKTAHRKGGEPTPVAKPHAPCSCGGGCPRCSGGRTSPEPRATALPARRPRPARAPVDAAEREARLLGPMLVEATRIPRSRAEAGPEAEAAEPSKADRRAIAGAQGLARPAVGQTATPNTQSPGSHGTAQRRATAPAQRPGLPAPARAPPPRRESLRTTSRPDRRLGSGRALSRPDRQGFEAALEQDLRPVRLHYGPVAASLAEDRGAVAYTYGTHIVLGRAAQTAPASTLRGIVAHELIHVVQQSAQVAPAAPQRWHHAPARAPPIRPLQRTPLRPQHIDLVPDVIADAAGYVYDGAVDLGADAIEGAVELAGDAADFAMEVGGVILEGAEEVVDYFAPGLLDFLRGDVLDDLADMFCDGIDALVGMLLNPLTEIDIMSSLEATFRGIATSVQAAYQAMGDTASAALGYLIQPIVQVITLWGDDIVSVIQGMADGISSVFTALWDNIAAPVLDFLGAVGGAVWEAFTGLVTWVWDLTAPLRRAAEWAWNWVKEQFNIAWNSSAGARSWLEEKATAAWEAFLELIEPIKTPLMVVGGILLMLSPLGPIVILTQVLPPIWEKLSWLAANWRDIEIVVRARTFLQEDVLPFILSSVETVKSFIGGAVSWLAGMAASVARGMADVVSTFGTSDCLKSVGRVLDHVADQFNRLQAWADGGFAGLKEALDAAFDALAAIFRPILDFLVRLAMVVLNPPLLPIAIAAAIWLLIPEEFKPPTINFVLDLMIAFLSGVPNFLPGLGPLVGVIKSAVLGFLRHLRSGEGVGDDARVNACNKIANIAAGGGPQFIAGYAVGLLQGLIEGIIDPFKLLFMLFELIVTGLRVLGQVLRPFIEAHAPSAVTEGLASLRTATAVPPPAAPGAAEAAQPAAGPGEATEAPAPETATLTSRVTRGPPAATETATLTRAPAEPAASTAGVPAADSAPATGVAEGPAGPEATAETGAGEAAAPEGEGAGGDDAADAALDASGLPSDAEIAANLSPQTISSFAGEAPPEGLSAEGLENDMRAEVNERGSTVSGLAQLLGDAWTAIMEGAGRLGGRIAGALLGFLQFSDYEIGNKIGWLSGMILLELIIAYFTAGGYTVLKQGASLGRRLLAYLLRFLDIGGEILGVLGRALAPLKGPILRGFGAARGFLSRFSFLRGLFDRIDGIARRIFSFGDEAAAAASHTPASRAAGAAPTPRAPDIPTARAPDVPTRAPDVPPARAPDAPPARAPDAPPTRAPDAPPATGRAASETTDQAGERAAREAMDSPPSRPAREAVEDLGNGSMRAVDEPGVPRVRDDAAKAAQFAEARIAARSVAETNDAMDTPIPLLLGQLIVLKRRYRWIETFRAEPQGPGVYEIKMIASEETIDGHYTTGSTVDVPGTPAARPGSVTDDLTPAQRSRLDDLRERHGWDIDEDQLRRLAREDGSVDDALAELEQLGRRANDPPHMDLDLIDTPLPTTTRHRAGVVDPDSNTARRALRNSLGDPPTAVPGAWQAHHIVPWELKGHPAIYRYERMIYGVDNPLADVTGRWMNTKGNGIYLPARDSMAEASDLAAHFGAHPRYTSWVEGRMNQLWHQYSRGGMSDAEFGRRFEGLVGQFENCLRTRCFGRETAGGGILLR